jgi:ribosomal protein L37AE/L43A
MPCELRDCPNCGARLTAQVIYERFGTETWWCVECGLDWDAHGPSLSIGTTQRAEAIATLAPALVRRSAA